MNTIPPAIIANEITVRPRNLCCCIISCANTHLNCFIRNYKVVLLDYQIVRPKTKRWSDVDENNQPLDNRVYGYELVEIGLSNLKFC